MFERLKKLVGLHVGCIAKTIIADAGDIDCWRISKQGFYTNHFVYHKGERSYRISVHENGLVELLEARSFVFNTWEKIKIRAAMKSMENKKIAQEKTNRYNANLLAIKPIFPNCFPQ